MEKIIDSRLFDIQKGFFLFDSDTLDHVQTRFDGYTIDNDQLIERIEDLEEVSALLSHDDSGIHMSQFRGGWPSGAGCYTLIRREPGKIV